MIAEVVRVTRRRVLILAPSGKKRLGWVEDRTVEWLELPDALPGPLDKLS